MDPFSVFDFVNERARYDGLHTWITLDEDHTTKKENSIFAVRLVTLDASWAGTSPDQISVQVLLCNTHETLGPSVLFQAAHLDKKLLFTYCVWEDTDNITSVWQETF